MTGILGKKLGMSRIVIDGAFVAVTYIHAEPNTVIQVKNPERDGYSAIVLGFDKYAKPSKNQIFKFTREIKVEDSSKFTVGQVISLADLPEFTKGHLTAISKGKGFQGPVKLWNRSPLRESHGSKYPRHGSTLTSARTGRSRKGLEMAARMGGEQITLKNRPIVAIYKEKNVFAVKGAIPGAADGFVVLHSIK